MDDILAALERNNADYPRACQAATNVAREYFDAGVVLKRILTEVGL
jgi:hypothetical protein